MSTFLAAKVVQNEKETMSLAQSVKALKGNRAAWVMILVMLIATPSSLNLHGILLLRILS